MNNRENNINEEESTIDLLQIFKALWKHIWIIALAGLAAAVVGLMYSSFLITPTYSSHVKLYVNNSSFSLGNTSFSISASELTAAQSLVKTYGEILNSRTTMERIIENAELDYTSSFFLNIARLTSLPFLHAIWCGIAGYFSAFAMLYPKYRRSLYFLAIAIPALLHGIYDTLSGGLLGIALSFSVRRVPRQDIPSHCAALSSSRLCPFCIYTVINLFPESSLHLNFATNK